MAPSVGMRLSLWVPLLYTWLGLCIGLSLAASGLLYTFGCLVLPALTAKNVAREVGPLFLLAPAIALSTTVVAFVLAHHYDHPPAQMAVALMSGLLVVAWVYRRVR